MHAPLHTSGTHKCRGHACPQQWIVGSQLLQSVWLIPATVEWPCSGCISPSSSYTPLTKAHHVVNAVTKCSYAVTKCSYAVICCTQWHYMSMSTHTLNVFASTGQTSKLIVVGMCFGLMWGQHAIPAMQQSESCYKVSTARCHETLDAQLLT